MKEEHNKADESKERILQSAIQEFALQGYDKASTNHIMETVGMAKGLLFHYFSSKQSLYLSCVQQVLTDVQKELDYFMRTMSDDLFERLASFLTWKNELGQEQPITLRFLYSISKVPSNIRKSIETEIVSWRKKNGQLLAHYDQTLWDPRINQKDALQVLVLLFDAFDQKWIQQEEFGMNTDQSDLLSYSLRMLDVLRVSFYTKE